MKQPTSFMPHQVTDFDIPAECKHIVVFVHGFGVRWDSRGMFPELKSALPKQWGSVLFDLYRPENNHVHVTTIEDQVKRLHRVLENTAQKAPGATIHLVAHSMGGIVTALAKPAAEGKIILLAPPTRFGGRMKQYFSQYPGATIEGEEIVVPRKDGSVTHIPYAFFDQTANINPIMEIKAYAAEHPLHVVSASNDEVLKDTDYESLEGAPGVTLTALPADHNFTGENRAQLVKQVCGILQD